MGYTKAAKSDLILLSHDCHDETCQNLSFGSQGIRTKSKDMQSLRLAPVLKPRTASSLVAEQHCASRQQSLTRCSGETTEISRLLRTRRIQRWLQPVIRWKVKNGGLDVAALGLQKTHASGWLLHVVVIRVLTTTSESTQAANRNRRDTALGSYPAPSALI